MIPNVIRFPREFVAIDCGMARTRIENEHGVGPWSDPSFEYRVEWNEPDGSSIVWTGSTYEDAVLAAAEWGLPVVDRTGGAQ